MTLLNQVVYSQARKRKRFLTPLWEFTRQIKAHSRVVLLSAQDARLLVHAALGEILGQDKEDFLWEHHLPCEDTKGGYVCPEDDFMNAWDTCSPAGTGSIETVVTQILASPPHDDRFGPEWSGDRHERRRQFLAVAQELQKLQGHHSPSRAWVPIT